MGKLLKIATSLVIGFLIFTLAACDGMIPGGTAPTDAEIGPHDHIFTEIIIKEATCTEEGQTDFVCDICGYTESHTTNPEHKFVAIDDKAPTCSSAGWENYEKCEACGQDFYTELEMNPNMHSFDEAGICSGCGKSAYEGIEFRLSGTYYTVVGVKNGQINEIWIPAQYEGIAVKAIGDNAFQDCQTTKIILPDTITTIGNRAFYGCANLTTLDIPSSVTEIGEEAFRDCGISTIAIPDGVTVLNGNTFSGCENLTSVTIGKGVKELGRFVFEKCSALANFVVSEENAALKAEDGVLYSKDGTVLYYYPTGNPRTSFTVPNGVKEIARTAFSYCANLTSVTLPEGLTHIHEFAFNECNKLASINLPETLQYIGDNALAYTALTKVVIPDSVADVGAWCFLQCKNLTSLTIGTGVINLGGQVVGLCENLTELIFRDPNNWLVDMMHLPINPDHLRTSSSAISTLRDSYCQNDWYKVVEE